MVAIPHIMVAYRLSQDSTYVPQQDARKNYIGIVSETTDEERIADGTARAQPRVVSYLFGRLAAVLGRTGKTAAGRTTTS